MARYWPNGQAVIPRVTSEFGIPHSLTTWHRGIDLVGYVWNHAADDGTVEFAGDNGTAGVEVRVRHDDGYRTRYLHNVTGSLQVRRGDRVTGAQRLARLGATGYVTGPHCHFEVIAPDGVTRINPRDYIAAGAPAGAQTSEEDTLSAAEVNEIKAHVTAEVERARIVAAGIPGNGSILVRYARSAKSGEVFALYRNARSQRHRVKVTHADDLAALADVYVESDAEIARWAPWEHGDLVRGPRPGRLVGHARSDVTGNAFALYEDDRGNRVRWLLPDSAKTPEDTVTVPRRELLTYAPTNQRAD